MGRDKLKRKLQFKPVCKEFGSRGCENKDTIHLLHEEMEALYLMDNQGLYQADAAAHMGVSRTTFARIIKSAREKVSMMLISGANLMIEDEKEDYTVLIASFEKEQVVPGSPDAPFLIFFHIQGSEIIRKKVLKNPVFLKKVRPGQILPTLCNELEVNFFMATSLGVGLKGALLSKGIYSISKKKFSEEELFNISY